LIIHVAAALTLYGALWRTLARLPEALFAAYARPLAFGIALLWAVHPLQTSAVTYIIQRCESLMGLFYLLTIYCVIRVTTDPRVPFGERESVTTWSFLAVLCCALGMGSKEVMVTAPFVALLYDRAFVSGSFGAAFRARVRLYGWLFATEGILYACVKYGSLAGHSAGFGNAKITSWHYLLTQCRVIPYYLRLSFWPDPLVIDHLDKAWLANSLGEVWLPGALLAIAVLVTGLGVVFNQRWAFLGAWFFLILGPTSSFMPINDPVFEHRMYLPLAAVLAGAILQLFAWCAAGGFGRRDDTNPLLLAVLLIAVPLSARTVWRNHDYSNDELIWRRAAERYPNSARICNNLGNALACDAAAMGTPDKSEPCRVKHEEAIRWFHQAVDSDPRYTDALFNLGVEYSIVKKIDESERYYLALLAVDPNYPNAHFNLADVYKSAGRYDDAIAHYRLELQRDGTREEAKANLVEAEELKDEEER
jgi:hypothetical protein